MQQRKIVEDYLSSIIPDKIADSTKSELREEIEGHIYDKAEFYMEIGYDEETAFKKAVVEMGEAEPVKEKLTTIYKDSIGKAFFLFFGLCSANFLSVIAGWGYAMLPDPPLVFLPNIVVMSAFLAMATFIIVHTVKCCRQKMHKQLTGITSAFVLMALGSFITSGLFYPIFSGIALNLQYIFSFIPGAPEEISGFAAYWINVIFLCIYALICFLEINSDNRFRKKKHLLSLRSISIMLSVLSIIMLINYGFAYEKYERWYPDESKEEWYAETPAEYFLPNITTEQRNIYLSIKGGDEASETEKMLTENGFVKQKKNYEDFLWDCLCPYYIRDYLLDKYQIIEANEYSIYCYTNGMEDEDDYDDIISCIVISYNSNNEVIYKLFIPDTEGEILNGSYQNYNHGEETQKWFDNLQKGENSKSALEFIRSTDSYIIEDERYENNKTLNTYKINMQCHYLLNETFIDFLFGYSPESVGYYFDLEIEAENGVLTEFRSIEE